MPNPDKPKSSWQQEKERRANDLIRVYNPTNADAVVEWDKKNGTKLFRVPASTEVVLIRYIAEKYIREMFDKMVMSEAMNAVKEENERRIKSGMAILDKTLKTGEQEQFESQFYVGNDEKARRIIALLYMGVENEFGVDQALGAQEQVQDNRPVFERAMENVQKERDVNPVRNVPDEVLSTPETPGVPTVQSTNKDLKCDWPGCEFSTSAKGALMTHKRSHRSEPVINDNKEEAVKSIAK